MSWDLVKIAAFSLGPALLVLLLTRKRRAPLGLSLALSVGVMALSGYLAHSRISGGLSGEPPVTIEVVLPDLYRGYVYLFFDSRQKPLQPSNPNVYTLFVPPGGRLRAGQPPDRILSGKNAHFAIRYLNGEPAPIAEGSQTGGTRAVDGWSALYIRPFVGTTGEFQAAPKESKDPFSLLEEMRQQALAPAKAPTPAALDGLKRPGP